jgi:hypothetical protein
VVSVFTDSSVFVRTEQSAYCVTFRFLTAVLLNIQILWDVAPCPFVGGFFFTFRGTEGRFSPSATSSQAQQSLQRASLLSYRQNVTLRKTWIFNFSAILPLTVIRVCPASQRHNRPFAILTVSCRRIAVFSYNNHPLPWFISWMMRAEHLKLAGTVICPVYDYTTWLKLLYAVS